jgi:predicted DNA-binding protein (UPF0251 family)
MPNHKSSTYQYPTINPLVAKKLANIAKPPKKKERRGTSLDLGIELLHAIRVEGVDYDEQEIAHWCQCSRQAINQIIQKALHKLGKFHKAELEDMLKFLETRNHTGFSMVDGPLRKKLY